MKKDPWLSSALIVSGTLHLLFLTQLIQTHQNALLETMLADSMLLWLGMPAFASNILAVVYQDKLMALIGALLYAVTIFVPMEGFELFMFPAFLCLVASVRMFQFEKAQMK
jgi:hypothetical protein